VYKNPRTLIEPVDLFFFTANIFHSGFHFNAFFSQTFGSFIEQCVLELFRDYASSFEGMSYKIPIHQFFTVF